MRNSQNTTMLLDETATTPLLELLRDDDVVSVGTAAREEVRRHQRRLDALAKSTLFFIHSTFIFVKVTF